jgi:hypothetical protein
LRTQSARACCMENVMLCLRHLICRYVRLVQLKGRGLPVMQKPTCSQYSDV